MRTDKVFILNYGSFSDRVAKVAQPKRRLVLALSSTDCVVYASCLFDGHDIVAHAARRATIFQIYSRGSVFKQNR